MTTKYSIQRGGKTVDHGIIPTGLTGVFELFPATTVEIHD
jgi:hypothetical protein